MDKIRNIHIGTSGWHYKHWIGPFYPKDFTPEKFLQYYIKIFKTVEINSSFYHLPHEKTLVRWRDSVPAEFVFSLKGSRFITHVKKLNDPKESLAPLLKRIKILKEKLGVILFQLPPSLKFNLEKLQTFLEAIPKKYKYAFEFRHESWFSDRTYEILSKYGTAFCIYELAGLLSPKVVTADFVYVRLHGPEGRYRGEYSSEVLGGWTREFSEWLKQGKEIYCYFDNDEAGYAPKDALKLKEILKEI